MSTHTPSCTSVPPGLYRHYKGGLYRVLGQVRHSETLEPMTLYQALYGACGLWVRPSAMFAETVMVNGTAQPRFSPVPEDGPTSCQGNALHMQAMGPHESRQTDQADAAPAALLAVVTTVDSAAQARHMAQTLLERRLAACVQITPIESHYHWDGALQQSQEWRLLCKTTATLQPDLSQAIAELHSYTVPAIYTQPLQAVHTPFAQWVVAETTPQASPTHYPATPATATGTTEKST